MQDQQKCPSSQFKDEMQVEPNRVYVIHARKNHDPKRDGHLKLILKGASLKPISAFFHAP